MKPFYLFLCIFLALFSKNNVFAQKRPFKVIGTLTDVKGDIQVFLQYGYGYDSKVISTHMINGVFEFKGKTSNPSRAYLYIKNHEDVVELFIEPNTETVVRGKENFATSKIEGGLIQSEYNGLLKKLEKVNAAIAQLVVENKTYKKEQNTEGLKRNEFRWELIRKDRDSIENQFTKENPSSFVSYNLAKSRVYHIDESFEPFFNLLDKKFRESPDGKEIEERLSKAKKFFIGQPTPNFTQKDSLGNDFSLTSHKGKYVLIDFWASWCSPCRQENPNLVKAYQQFKAKNFEIIGVSLDKNKAKWLDAIKKDSLSWLHVSDLKGWKNEVAKLYEVRFIPQNILIDPNGIIIAKNITGVKLDMKLGEILGVD
jgi:peroxiredoxin